MNTTPKYTVQIAPRSSSTLAVENGPLRAGPCRLGWELLAGVACKHQEGCVGISLGDALGGPRVQALLALTRGPPGTSIDMRGMRSPRSALAAIQ